MNWRSRAVALALMIGAALTLSSAAGAHDKHFKPDPIKRSVVQVKVPAVTLVRQDGAKIDLAKELADPRPTYVNFIFTSCTTVCPVMSQIFAVLQEKLGTDRDKVRMMSISIDPEHDTPARLAAYASAFDAASQWRFFTGTNEASIAVQKAFGILGRDKMNHPVASFFQAAPDQPWVRIDGFASADQLEAEYRNRMAKGGS
jgi:protein SCO1/2